MVKNLQLLFFCIAFLAISVTHASAETIVVDTLSDSSFDNCTIPNKCGLRSAIIIADPGDTITFTPTLKGGTITLLWGELTIDKHLVIYADIDSDHSSDITIHANSNSRVIRINSSLLVTLDGLTIKYGLLAIGGSGGGAGIKIDHGSIVHIKNSTFLGNESKVIDGGGIATGSGMLFLNNCNFVGNKAPSGGAIYNNSGTIDITNSIFDSNESQGEGGGIYNSVTSSANISDSVFKNNYSRKYSSSLSLYYSGGAITNMGELSVTASTFQQNGVEEMIGSGVDTGDGGGVRNGGIATIKDCTFWANTAEEGGGAWNNKSLTLLNSTFSENFSDENGAALFSSTSGPGETLEIRNCTFYDNWSFSGLGGGIYLYYATSPAGEHMSNTIIADSTYEDCYIEPGRGGFETNSSNLIEDGSCSPAFSGDPLLMELAYNGGPTMTHALKPDSPAINKGNNAELPINMVHDQRGPGFPRIHDETVDIGAYEYKKSHFYVVPHSGGKAVIFNL